MKTIFFYWKETSLFFGLLFLYRDSFLSPFFQDDKILFEVAKTKWLFEPIVNFPYRPIAIQFFYSLSSNSLVLHVIQFILFLLGLIFLHKLLRDWFVTVFVAFNISIFPLFYWTATSYFSFAFLFTFSALFFYFRNNNLLALVLFIAGLLSNEIMIVFPALLVLFSWLKKIINLKKIIAFLAIDVIYLPLRIFLVPFPTANDYQISFGQLLSTIRWYLLRVLNLPEGIRGEQYLIYFLFGVLVILILLKIVKCKLKIILFSTLWFLVGAVPFFFLPNHMSSYYLTISTFGPAVFLSKILGGKNKIIFMIIYLLLAFLGLEYLKQTHWIILKNTGPIGSFL